MSALMDRAEATVRVCQECGEEFEDRSRTSPRSYCYSCRPARVRSRAEDRAPDLELPGNPFEIAHFKAWASRLRLKGEAAFVLEAWEERFIADVLAAIRRESAVQECWLIVPEGNGKSTLVAVLILYCVEFAEDANIPVAAAARDQAEIIFTQGTGFTRRSPDLRGRFECKPGLREIVFGGRGKAKIFASDASTGDGVIPWPIEVLDELHRHRDLELYRTWAGKLDKEGSVLVVISTAGEPGSEFEDTRKLMRRNAVAVERDGCFGRYLGATSVLHEYAVPEGGDVEDLELVKGANPSSRITVETLAAKRGRPSWSLPHWRRLTCNLPTRGEFAAVSEGEWERQRVAGEIPEGDPIWLGVDLGWKVDPTALVPFWWRDADFRLFGKPSVITPPGGGDSTDPALVQQAFLDIHARNPIEVVVMDPHGGEMLAEWVRVQIGAQVVERQQSLTLLALDYSRFMEGLRLRRLWHVGDPVLTEHVLNAVARPLPRGDSVFERPHRGRAASKQDRRVVDALDAAAMVHSTAVAEHLPRGAAAGGWRGL